jgi:hypothetical protein
MDTSIWIEEQWGQAKLGDARRNHRAIKLAEDLLKKPSASLPKQCADWSTLKAAYRFFNEQDVTFEALQQPHRKYVIEKARQSETVLFIQDGSELDYTSHDLDLGPIGDHRGHGFFLHTTMAVQLEKENSEVIGIAHQILWERGKVKKQETRTQRRARATEADVWANSVKAIGQAPSDCLWINIGDRGADIFEFLETCHSYNHHVVIRMIQNRKVVTEGQEGKILEILQQKTSHGMFELHRRGHDGEPKKIHHLHVSWSGIEIQPPKYMGKKKEPILGTYIRVWEEKPGELEWILFTSLPINNFEEALEKIKWYARRWMIEEYHKCLKTGCNVEKRNFRSGKALEALIGMLGIIAAKILELKYLVKNEANEEPAKNFISEGLIAIISRRYKLDKMEIKLKDFWRNVAKLGGFLGRKNDGDPGWQTLWQGWIRLLDMQDALEDFQKCG